MLNVAGYAHNSPWCEPGWRRCFRLREIKSLTDGVFIRIETLYERLIDHSYGLGITCISFVKGAAFQHPDPQRLKVVSAYLAIMNRRRFFRRFRDGAPFYGGISHPSVVC